MKKNNSLFHAGTLCLLVSMLSGLPATLHAQWTLVWQDEFNGSISSDWSFETGAGGWGNNELEYYRSENASIENGALVITAKNESYGGSSYTSARMITQGHKTWTFGRIEARMKLPAFSGSWPAFWMLGSNISSVGWPSCGEIDIMEHVNTESLVYGTAHWLDNNSAYASYGGNKSVTVTDYHIYAIEWNTNYITWYVDGVQFHQIYIGGGINGTSEFQNSFFILLNMAVGGNWPGFTIDNSAFPAKMYVDYVRVYQSNSNTWSTQIEAENWSVMSGVATETCSEGTLDVGWIDTNDWIVWDVNVPTAGSYTVSYRVASPNSGGVLQFEQAGGSPIFGSISIPNTGGWQNWTTISQVVTLSAGQQQIAIKALAGGWNINWLKIGTGSNARMAETTTTTSTSTEKLLLYPNPASDQINLSGITHTSTAAIYDLSGKALMRDITLTPEQPQLTISALRPGIYLLLVNGQKIKFIKD